MTGDINYDELDPGIREVVRWLRYLGFDTTDSGDGVTKVGEMACAIAEPHVFMVVNDFELLDDADTLHTECSQLGLPAFDPNTMKGFKIEATYDPADASAILALYGVNDEMLAEARKLKEELRKARL